jgi:hypothetical protein
MSAVTSCSSPKAKPAISAARFSNAAMRSESSSTAALPMGERQAYRTT